MTLQRTTGDILHVLKVWKIRSSEKKYTSEVNNLFEETRFKESHKNQFTDYHELVDASSETDFSMISTSHSATGVSINYNLVDVMSKVLPYKVCCY